MIFFRKAARLLSILLLFTLAGCGLVNTLIKLAPLAAVLVYYSAPTPVDEESVLCFKTKRIYRQQESTGNSSAEEIENEYYLCLVEGGRITELARIFDDGFYELSDGSIAYDPQKERIYFTAGPNKPLWQADKDGSNLKRSTHTYAVFRELREEKTARVYACLPPPSYREISR